MRLSARLSLSALIATTLLTGCALTNTATPGISTGAALKGNVHGGQQPVVGAHVYLFAAGTSGYGGPSTSLLNSNTDGTDSLGSYVLSDANGGFSITGDYTCTSGTQVYLLATGGNPGLPAPQANPNLALMTNLGQCPASGSFAATIPTVSINEVTTVASVYAISGFMTDLTHVSSSGTLLAQTGIANAFATTNNLVDITTGGTLTTTPAGNGTVPQAEINTLANIIATCVNSNGASSTTCTTLFATALNGTIQATDTVTAALNIAHNPGTGIAALYALSATTPPFAPALTAQPNDFTIALSFAGRGLGDPDGIAIDSEGNVWIPNTLGNSITKLSSLGVEISPSTGYPDGNSQYPEAIAIDTSDNVWVTNYPSSDAANIAKFSNSGAALSPPGGYVGGGLNEPLWELAIDGAGNAWVMNGNNSISEFSNSGTPVSPSTGFTGGGLNQSTGIGVDSSGNAWVTGQYGVAKFSPTGVALSPSTGFTGGGLYTPIAVAFDASGNAWFANYGGDSATKLSSTGAAISPPSGFTGGGVLSPQSMAIDGSGNVWLGSAFSNNIAEFSNSGIAISPPTGFISLSVYLNILLAIDGSGNVWATNGSYNSVAEFVGAATPVVTPIASGAANNTLGTRP